MARLSIGSQHFQTKERRSLSLGKATKVSPAPAQTTSPAPEPENNPEDPGNHAHQNKMLAMRNAELARAVSELEATVLALREENTYLRSVASMERESSSELHLDLIETAVKSTYSRLLGVVHGLRNEGTARDLDLVGRSDREPVSTSTPNHSKSSLGLWGENGSSTPVEDGLERESGTSTPSADVAMMEGASASGITLGKTILGDLQDKQTVSLEENDDSDLASVTFFKKRSRSLSEDLDIAKSRRLGSERTIVKSEGADAYKKPRRVVVKQEPIDVDDTDAQKGKTEARSARRPLSTISLNKPRETNKKAFDDSIFDFADTNELAAQNRTTRK